MVGLLFVVALVGGDEAVVGYASRGLPTPRHDAALLLVIGGLHSAVARSLAASLGAWYCLTIFGAVRDIIEGRRSRQRQPVRTWPAADGGASSMAGRYGTTPQDGAGDIFDPLARWRRVGQGGSNVKTSNYGGGMQLVLVSGGRGTSSGYLDDNS
jgi:hypothetical protein